MTWLFWLGPQARSRLEANRANERPLYGEWPERAILVWLR